MSKWTRGNLDLARRVKFISRYRGYQSGEIVEQMHYGRQPASDHNVSNPPTDAELDAAFGVPATVGDGFVGIVDDAGAGSAVWIVVCDGTSWWYTPALTKAV